MNTTQIEELLDEMTLEEQVSLLTGADFWTTMSIPRLGVPAFKVSSGTNDRHLYLNSTQWYTAFPQIASRVGHDYPPVFEVLAHLISTVIKEYPQQTLWLFASVVKSRNNNRASRGRTILEKLQVRFLNMFPSFIRTYFETEFLH